MLNDGNSILYGADPMKTDHVYFYNGKLISPRKGMSAVNIHHNNKNNGQNGYEAYTGITAWHNAARARWSLGDGVWKHEKNNYAAYNQTAMVGFNKEHHCFILGNATAIEGEASKVDLKEVVRFIKVCNANYKRMSTAMKSTLAGGNTVLNMKIETQFKNYTNDALWGALAECIRIGVLEVQEFKSEKGKLTHHYAITESGEKYLNYEGEND
jgi:hypothetical protein